MIRLYGLHDKEELFLEFLQTHSSSSSCTGDWVNLLYLLTDSPLIQIWYQNQPTSPLNKDSTWSELWEYRLSMILFFKIQSSQLYLCWKVAKYLKFVLELALKVSILATYLMKDYLWAGLLSKYSLCPPTGFIK